MDMVLKPYNSDLEIDGDAAKNATRFSLREGGLVRMDGDLRQAEIECLNGAIWVTQPNDDCDYLLTAGKHFQIGHKGIVLVQGLPEGKFQINKNN
jgi:predicted regulator of Ras-like GTPase activity (Roadblock/LC7/MglB family)